MLWYKAWLETRWRFFTGLILLTGTSVLTVLMYPYVAGTTVSLPNMGGRLGEMVRDAIAMMTTYPGYIWLQWFGKNLLIIWTLCAILIGVGGIVTESSRGTALFTLSLPVTRRRQIGIRGALGAAELVILAAVPSFLIPAFSSLIGESYPLRDALIYTLVLITSGMSIFSVSFLLAVVFSDQMKPIIILASVAFLLALPVRLIKGVSPYSIFTLMSGEAYFVRGEMPWPGLLACAVFSAAMFYLAFRVVEQRDF